LDLVYFCAYRVQFLVQILNVRPKPYNWEVSQDGRRSS